MNPPYIKTVHNDVYPGIDSKGALKGVFSGTVFISGASRGIGRAMAIAFAQAGAGTIGLGARTADELAETAKLARSAASNSSVKVYTYSLDVAKPESVERVWQDVVREVGVVDVLLNNSGATSTGAAIGDLAPSDFWHAFEVNVFGIFLMSRQFVKHGNPRGTIINTSSIVSRIPIGPNRASYYASKTAANKLGEGLQADYPNLRIFSMHPGVVPTQLAKSVMPAERVAAIAKDTPDLAAGFAVWLTTPAADPAKGGFLSANWDVDELMAYWQQSGKPAQIRTVPNWEEM